MLKINTLVIEDELVLFMLLEKKIAKHNLAQKIKISNAPTLEEAVELNSKFKYDGVFLDLNLPTSSGLKTLEKALEIFDIPIIVFSSLSKDEDLAYQCIEMGAYDLIPKTVVVPEEFYRRMCYAILKYNRKKALETV